MKDSRRNFLKSISLLSAGIALPLSSFSFGKGDKKLKIALIGTGIRGTKFWGKRLVETYPEIIEFVGLCDNNPGRLAYGQKFIGVQCPLFSDFEKTFNIL